jgi:membrane-bound lytic murein transglycosylase D
MALAAAQASAVDKVEFVADAGETETYKVRSGDSLYTIARKYHTTVAWLRDTNDLKSGKKLRIGMRLQVPDRASGRISSKKQVARLAKPATIAVPVAALGSSMASSDENESAASNPEVVTKKGVYYIVQPGDTLSAIADEYDASLSELRRMNKLGKGSMIKVGMKLRVPKDEGLPKSLEDNAISAAVDKSTTSLVSNSASQEVLSHTVRAGENLSVIAKQYGVTVQQIREANNLKPRAKINTGATLLIPVRARPSSSVDSGGRRLPASRRTVDRQLAHVKLVKVQKQTHHAQIKIHVVKKGESLTHIANRYQVSLHALKERNRLQNDSRLLVGAKLLIPIAEARASY